MGKKIDVRYIDEFINEHSVESMHHAVVKVQNKATDIAGFEVVLQGSSQHVTPLNGIV